MGGNTTSTTYIHCMYIHYIHTTARTPGPGSGGTAAAPKTLRGSRRCADGCTGEIRFERPGDAADLENIEVGRFVKIDDGGEGGWGVETRLRVHRHAAISAPPPSRVRIDSTEGSGCTSA